jgi:hypothetical protein
MEHDRELLAALVQNKKDMKSLREAVDALREDLQKLTTAVKDLSSHLDQRVIQLPIRQNQATPIIPNPRGPATGLLVSDRVVL